MTKNTKGISQYSRGEDIIPQIIKELGIKPDYNLLKNTKFLIFVEGKDDVHFLQIAARTVLDKNLVNDGILCVIGGGSSLKNYADLDLFKKLSLGSQYAVFVDGNHSDETKKKEQDKIKKQCEADSAIFHKLSKKEIENFCCPDKIKQCYIQEIKDREGEQSQNPRKLEIESLNINIQHDTDVEDYLKSMGLFGFKSGMNIKVLKSMTKEEWQAVDTSLEIKGFIENIYQNIR